VGEEVRPDRPLARAARTGDRDARNALWVALAPKIDRLAVAAGRRTRGDNAPRRDGRPWDAEDLRQEAFPLFADLLAAWSGEGPIGPYLLSHLAWRLRSVARALAVPRRFETSPAASARLHLADGSAAAAEALILLEALAADLPTPDGAILLRHVRDAESLAVVALRLGLDRRTVYRRWQAIKDGLRNEERGAI
jgi:DNA-directed RNA polymerase specialized sigma24 family protein